MKLWKTVAKMDPRAKVWPRPDVLVRVSNKLQHLQLMLGPSRGALPALSSILKDCRWVTTAVALAWE